MSMSDDIKEEKKLVKQSIKGDKKSLEKLVEKYIDFCYSIAILFLEDDKLAKKALEMTLMQVYNTIGDLYDPKGFRVWLYDILKTSISKSKSKGKMIESSSMDLSKNELKAKINYLTLNEIENDSLVNSEKLLFMLRSLPEDQKEIVALVDFEGLSCSDVAVLLDINVSDVRQKLYSAKSKLKEIFFPVQNKKVRDNFKQPIVTEPVFESIPPMIQKNQSEPAIEDILWGTAKETKKAVDNIIINNEEFEKENIESKKEIDIIPDSFIELENELNSYKKEFKGIINEEKPLFELTEEKKDSNLNLDNLLKKDDNTEIKKDFINIEQKVKSIQTEEKKEAQKLTTLQKNLLKNDKLESDKNIDLLFGEKEEPQIIIHNFDDEKNSFLD